MELRFLGRGSATNPLEGSNSAFVFDKESKQLFLIDCGETTFQKLIELGVLDEASEVNLFITHTHSDHIGSLGSLASYLYYNLKKPLHIIVPDIPIEKGYLNNINGALEAFGIKKVYPEEKKFGEWLATVDFKSESSLDYTNNSFISARYKNTTHYDGLSSYSLLFHTNGGIIYYSGDSNSDETIKWLVKNFISLDKMYVDVTSVDYPGNVHLYINRLNDVIPDGIKEKVHCMHINDEKCIELANEYGFNVVDVATREELHREDQSR